MKTLEIQVSTDLYQRLQPYKDRLAHILDLSLKMLALSADGQEKPVENVVKEATEIPSKKSANVINKAVEAPSAEPAFDLAEYKKTESYRQQKELIEWLHREEIATGPDIDTMLAYIHHPDQRNRKPVHVGGKPVSEMIIEERRRWGDE